MRNQTARVLTKHPERLRQINKAYAATVRKFEGDSESLTDLGNARRLVALHGKDLRYCHALGKWVVWDGTRWRLDATEEVTRRMVEVVHQMHGSAASQRDRNSRKALEDWARKSESEGKIRAAISLCQSQRAVVITPDDLDQQPWLLNCENGTLDLKTLELRPHQRQDFLTQKAGAPYDPNATCPTWDAFLNLITGGKLELQAFLQRAIGYTLTGLTSEQCLFILYGTGQNGKSTFLEAIRAMLGEYAAHAEFSTFLYQRNRSIRNDLAALRGARFITAIEADPGDRLSESVIKAITGGDPITARFLHREFFTYRPTYKLFLAVNDKPIIRGGSKGTWRRIRLVPFTVEIAEQQQDKHFAEKLRRELPGILAWAVRGCEQWRDPGLNPPAEVTRFTAEYREEMDSVGRFLAECCVLELEAETKSAVLYPAYKDYCERGGERPLPRSDFCQALEQHGCKPDRLGKKRTRCWKGLRLAADDDAESTG
jgi:putative DNA primase/helicase